MINDASLKVIFTDFWLHLDELAEANSTVDVVAHLLVAFGFEVNESRQVFILKFVHAIFC